MIRKAKSQSGITLIETIIGVAIFALVAFSVYQGLAVLLDVLNASKIRVAATDLAGEEIETIRNMPYVNVGTLGGVPAGSIPQNQTKTKNGINFTVTTAVRNIDDPFDGTLSGSPNDSSPADYKLVELSLQCLDCGDGSVFRFTLRSSPKGLEGASTNGALFIQAIDANGLPVAGANVQVVNSSVAPAININDTAGADGFLRIVDVPPSVQNYRVTVSKTGYSTERTYAPDSSNPNPVKPDLTVALQTITQSTFSIDRTSVLNVASVTDICASVPNINFTVSGTKLIGTTPDVLKFSQSYATDGSGAKAVNGLEWDNYKMIFVNAGYDPSGTIPLLPITLQPNAALAMKFVMKPANPLALMVTARDAASLLPLASTTIAISGPQNETLISGRGFLAQTDWSGGSGQPLYINPSQYFSDDGNVEINFPTGEIKLKKIATSTYAASGILESSTFDTGSPSNFYFFGWLPQSQPPDTGSDSVKFQIATATTTNPVSWVFKGPDGSSASFYTTANGNVNSIHNGDRYLRYKAYLFTASTTFTPIVSDVIFTFASECVPPGQVLFQGLTSGSYNLTLTRDGYQPINDVVTVNTNWKEKEYLMNP